MGGYPPQDETRVPLITRVGSQRSLIAFEKISDSRFHVRSLDATIEGLFLDGRVFAGAIERYAVVRDNHLVSGESRKLRWLGV